MPLTTPALEMVVIDSRKLARSLLRLCGGKPVMVVDPGFSLAASALDAARPAFGR